MDGDGTNRWYSRYQRLVLALPTFGTRTTNIRYSGYQRLVLWLPIVDTHRSHCLRNDDSVRKEQAG